MALGPVIKVKTDTGLHIQLAPFTRDQANWFVLGFQRESMTQYLGDRMVQTVETEQAWYDRLIVDENRLTWGIWYIKDDKIELIGNATLADISGKVIVQAVDGIAIFNEQFWGKGVASAVQKALVWYAFQRKGITRLKAAVYEPNIASRKALENAGYFFVYTERNDKFVDGHFIHKDCFECLNPDDWAWRLWWSEDRPTRKAVEARARTLETLKWAKKNVELL